MKTTSVSYFTMLAFTAAVFFSSCKKDDNNGNNNNNNGCSGCEGIIAKATYDSSEQGVYKGLMLSGEGIGHFRLNIKNGDELIYLKLKFTRGTNPVLNDSLTPSGTVTITPGTPITATLIGSASRTDIFAPPVNQNPSVSDFTISGSIGTGPKPQSAVLKELSTEQVKVYEGTMQETTASSPNGKIGFVVRGSKIIGIITNATNTLRQNFYNGTLDASGNFSFSFSGNNSTFTGKLSGSEITGSFTLQGSPAGTFTAALAY